MRDYGIYIYKDKVVIHAFLPVKAKVYRYNQVNSIVYTPETRQYGAHYDVKFNDGEDWNTLTDLRDDSSDRDVNYIAKRSGLRVDTLFHDPQ